MLALVLIALGIGIIIWSSMKFMAQKERSKHAIFAVGTIIDYEYSNSNRANLSDDQVATSAGRVIQSSTLPIIEFTNQAGDRVTFTSDTTAQVGVGGEVDVMYDPARPSEAKLAGYFNLFGWLIMIGGIGALLVFIGVLIRFVF